MSTSSESVMILTNYLSQRETTVVWDTETGEPLYNAIVWTDTRTAALARDLKNRPGADGLMDICGEPLSTYPSASKLTWLMQHEPKVQKAYEAGKLSFGTVDAWLVYNLNGKEKNVFVTDVTNASRTMFMNIHKLQYDQTLLDFFQLDTKKIHLPKIVNSSDLEAYGSLGSGPLKGKKITGCLGDQSSALVGQGGFAPGRAKNTYGTGCFLLYNTGEKPVISTHGLLTTVAYAFTGMKPVYALEGSIAVGGSSVKFLMNNLGFFRDSAKVSEVAETVEDNGGLVFVTAFSGLFAPYWIDDAKGTICKFEFLSSHHYRSLCSSHFHASRTNNKCLSRTYTIHLTWSHCPRHPRGNMLPNQSHPLRHGKRFWSRADRTRSRRRHVQLRPDHANPIRPDPNPRQPTPDARDHRLGRSNRRRFRHRRLQGLRRSIIGQQ